MCGIVGLFDTRGKREFDRRLLGRMNQIQAHRGPDEGELYTEPGIGLRPSPPFDHGCFQRPAAAFQ